MKSFFKKIPIIIILSLTLALLVFVGYGEARRTFFRYRLETSILQSDTLVSIIQPFVDAGFPLTMYGGYDLMSEGLMEANNDVVSFRVLDKSNKIIFKEGHERDLINVMPTEPCKFIESDSSETIVTESDKYFVIKRYLSKENKTEIGYFLILLDRKSISGYLIKSYSPVFITFVIACIILAVLFTTLTSSSGLISKYKLKSFAVSKYRKIILKLSYTLAFFVLCLVVTFITIDIFNDGIQGKTRAIGKLLANRLAPVRELGLEFDDLKGVNDILKDFKDRYSFVNSASLTSSQSSNGGTDESDSAILYDSDPSMIGQIFNPDTARLIVYQAPLHVSNVRGEENAKLVEGLQIVVSVPRKEIQRAIFKSLINFLALIIGCILIAMIFLDVGLAFAESLVKVEKVMDPKASLQLIKAAYFLVVFISSLSVPFLPQLVSELNNGMASSLPFSIYYLFFALVLIPAGNISGKGKIKQIMGVGFIAEILGCFLVASSISIPLLTIGRAMSGLGQGCFLIGFQSYVLSVTPPEQRTQGAALKVIARNSALIGGTAIGALLYVFMGYRDLFILSSGISLLGFVYLIMMVPKIEPTSIEKLGKKKLELKNIPLVFKDSGFLKVLLLTGIPAKMGITGVVSFAIPLLMVALSFTQEAIGQFLMIFYIISMVTTKIASRYVDKSGKITSIIFMSALVGGGGMLLMGYMSGLIVAFSKLFVVLGLFCVGVSNGLISAPIITYITKTKSSNKYGYSPMVAVYTFLERFGHILGPIILTLLMASFKGKIDHAIGVFGTFVIVLGFFFVIVYRKKDLVLESDGSVIIDSKKNLEPVMGFVKEKETFPITGLSFNIEGLSDVLLSLPKEDQTVFVNSYNEKLYNLLNTSQERFYNCLGEKYFTYWNHDFSDDVNIAASSALKIKHAINDINSDLLKSGNHLLKVQLGLHSGEAWLNESNNTDNNQIAGEAVAFASYLERLNYKYGTKIIASNISFDNLDEDFICRPLDVVEIAGGEKRTCIYEIMASSEFPLSEGRKNFRDLYIKGFNLYLRGKWKEALKCFSLIRQKLNRSDMSVEIMYKRSLFCYNQNILVPDDWDGVFSYIKEILETK